MPQIPAPPTEHQILTSYLLNPASLPTILSLDQFRNLFPNKFREHPQIKRLYRDLQFLRSVDIDNVRENIAQEVRRGDRMKVEMWRSLRAGQKAEDTVMGEGFTRNGTKQDDPNSESDIEAEKEIEQTEMQLDTMLFGQAGSVARPPSQLHSLESLLGEMETAAEVLEAEAKAAEVEMQALVAGIQETVSSLSDLRYGTFARVGGSDGEADVGEEVKKALQRLENTCQQNV